MLLDSLSNAAVYRGDLGLALEYSKESLDLADRAGDPGTYAHALINLADIRARLDDLAGAMIDANRGLALARELGEQRPISHALSLLGKIAIAQESFTAAAHYSRESLEIARSVSDLMGMTHAISLFAHAIGADGRTPSAARLLGATLAAREALGAPLRTDERERVDPLIEGWRVSLGEAVFAEHWAAGQALDLEAAADEALALDPD
jgi:hypothetical protein